MGHAIVTIRPRGDRVVNQVISGGKPVTCSDPLTIRLGNLLETPFEQIWRSPARERVAQAIHAAPIDGESCAAYSGCFGGCRGLVYLASGSTDPGKATGSEEAAASSPKAA